VERLTAAAEEGGVTLFVSGVDPGLGNDALAVIAAGLCTRIKANKLAETAYRSRSWRYRRSVRSLDAFARFSPH
jgi:hypothetical protein